MGCSDSKSADTKPQKKPESQGDKKDEDVYITVEEAQQYLVEKLCIDPEHAQMIVCKVNKNDDNKIKNCELEQLCAEIDKVRGKFLAKFKELDTDGNKTLTREQAESVIKEVLGEEVTQLLGEESIVAKFDHDTPGTVYYEEFCLFYAYLKTRHADMVEKFKEMDKDNSGYFDAEEFQKVLEEVGGVPGDKAKCLCMGDYNKDGKISKEEFIAFWQKMYPES